LPEELAKLTGHEFFYVREKTALSKSFLEEKKPDYVFFPFWSFLIPAEIFEAYECVIFHMTDLPFGRGGSPLQNLLARGIYDTKISALRCTSGIDAGPIYLKKPFSLRQGSAAEIYQRAVPTIRDMIVEILSKKLKPVEQTGEPTVFARRKEEDGNLTKAKDIEAIYDWIRMLDAEGYPRAFLPMNDFRLEFDQASLDGDRVTARVTIKKK
jgi:methionyl-tRNA formyltransferase